MYINTSIYNLIVPTESYVRNYGLPKIHKQSCPFRLIISSIDNPLYPLFIFVLSILYSYRIISKNISKPFNHIDNSFQLVDKLFNYKLTKILISLNTSFLFLLIYLLTINYISNHWTFISDCNIPKNEFIKVIILVLRSTYFIFNNYIYKQTFGTPISSPLSSVTADLILCDLEEKVRDRIWVLLYCYIWDMWTILLQLFHLNKIDEIQNIINSFYKSSNFLLHL